MTLPTSRHIRQRFQKLFVSTLACLSLTTAASATEPGKTAVPLKWQIKTLCIDAKEGVDVGDVDGDGKPDVVAGRNWYSSPEFVARPLRSVADWNGYVESNGDYLMDVNRDGRLDVIAGSFLPTAVHWYENPGAKCVVTG